MPPRGYCPLCVVETTEADEVEVADRGTVTTFSVITPLQYQGQQETEDYVQGTILLDGADTTIMVMRMDGIPIADMRMGMRVQAVWPPEGEARRGGGSLGNRGMGLGDAVASWEPTGEPDLTRSRSRSTSSDARRCDRLLRAGAARAAAGSDRDADVAADDHRGAGGRRA